MTTTIAVAGKGGVGKTTFIAMLIQYIRSRELGVVLAIDGDPAANLNMVLGMQLPETVGRIREDTRTEVTTGRYDTSIPKADFFEYRINESLIEGDRVDLIAMGRPEGPGCYCAANSILRNVIDRLGNGYDYVVIDNEAGLEHISRQTTRDVDKLFILTDMTMRGVATAGHIAGLITELGTRMHETYLVINRASSEVPPTMRQEIDKLGLNLVGTLPEDPLVAEFDMSGKPLIEIGEDSPSFRAVAAIAEKAGIKK
jgi:CO dehydrogenase maturation factor